VKPKPFLNFLSKEWSVILTIFEMTRGTSIDFVELDQIVSTKKPGTDIRDFIKRFEENEVLTRELSYGTNYTLTDKADQIVELLLDEQQLGMSENIRIYIDQFDSLSMGILKSVQGNDIDSAERTLRRFNQQVQSVRRQTKNNLQAIENLVLLSKKQDSYIPLKQRYADVIYAWDEYIVPMGEFIDVNKAFDATIDSVLDRLNQSSTVLEKSGAQYDIRRNIRIHKDKILDMKDVLLSTYRESKRLLEPMYHIHIARLNSEVTKGISNILDLARKEQFNLIDKFGLLPIFKKDKSHFTNNDSGIKKYYLGLKNIKEDPAPPIAFLTFQEQEKRNRQFIPPLNKPKILEQFEQSLPVEDALQWAINKYPGDSTGRILNIMWLVTNHGWQSQKFEKTEYKTKYHRLIGRRIRVDYGKL